MTPDVGPGALAFSRDVAPSLVTIPDLDERVTKALRQALAPNTWKAYAADWRAWSAWAHAHNLPVLPAQPLDLARYLVDQAPDRRIGTLTRRLSAIGKAHALAGHGDPTDDPAVREVLRGLRREHGSARTGAPPLWTSDIERIVDATYAVEDSAHGTGQGSAEVRDRALLLLAFTSALRRSELSALDLDDLEPDPAELIEQIARSKADQHGEGTCLAIRCAAGPRLCAVKRRPCLA